MKLLLPKKLLKIVFVALLFVGQYSLGQTAISNTSAVIQDFNSMLATKNLPANWRMHASTSSPTWAAASTLVTQEASSGTPTSGGTYNFGSTISERAVGAMTSGTFASPNNLLGFFQNTNAANLTSLTISYDAERYRINTSAASVQFYYSTNGTSWTAVNAGDIATSSFPTGSNTYSFSGGTVVNKTGISITGLNIATNGSIYLRWNINTTGSSSQAIAIDNISVTAAFATLSPTVTTVAASSITTTDAIISGTINANGFTVASSFEYGTTISYGTTEVGDPASVVGTTTTAVDAIIGSLAVNTLYNYRAVGSVSGTPTNGANMTFYTLAATPGVLVVSNPTQNTLDVAVTATTQNSNPAATLFAIQETGGQYVQANGSLGATAVWQTAATWATVTVTGLSSSTLYAFQTKARNGATVPVETIFGATASGTTTAPAAPVVTSGTTTGTYNVSFSYAITASNTPTSMLCQAELYLLV